MNELDMDGYLVRVPLLNGIRWGGREKKPWKGGQATKSVAFKSKRRAERYCRLLRAFGWPYAADFPEQLPLFREVV